MQDTKRDSDFTRQIAVILSVLLTLAVNVLANALPLNGQTTAEISDRFDVYFVPAGYVFSIWGVIYLGLIAYAVYQTLPAQRENPRLQATGWWVVISGLANSAWIFLWHYEQFPLTVVAMLALLVSLILIYLRLGTGLTRVSRAETWMARVPFSIYLGWISVAAVANISALLDYWDWNGFGLAPEMWMWVLLAVVLALTLLMIFTRRDVAYVLVILWALAGIGVKHAAVGAVAYSTWITFGLTLIGLAAGLFVRPLRRNAAPEA